MRSYLRFRISPPDSVTIVIAVLAVAAGSAVLGLMLVLAALAALAGRGIRLTARGTRKVIDVIDEQDLDERGAKALKAAGNSLSSGSRQIGEAVNSTYRSVSARTRELTAGDPDDGPKR